MLQYTLEDLWFYQQTSMIPGTRWDFQPSGGRERKYNNQNYDAPASGTLYNVTQVANGVDANSRIGRTVTATSFEWVASLSAYATANAVRMLIILDRQPNGAIPAVSTILTSNTVAALQNPDTEMRFEILWDESVACMGSGQIVHRKIPLHFETQYKGATSGTASIATNELYFWVADQLNVLSKLSWVYRWIE